MNKADGGPFLIAFFFVLRCLVPLAIMLGISYLLHRLKLVAEPPAPPPGWENNDVAKNQNPGDGGMAHGQS